MANLRELLTKEIAVILSVDRRTISRWCRTEDFPRNKDGTFDGPACVKWLADRIEAGTTARLETAQNQPGACWLEKYREYRAGREKLALERERGELVALAEVEQEWSGRVREIRSGLYTLVDRLPGVLVGKDRRQICEVLEDEVELLLHSYHRKGRYTPEIRSEILEELGGKTNRQRKMEAACGIRQPAADPVRDPEKGGGDGQPNPGQ